MEILKNVQEPNFWKMMRWYRKVVHSFVEEQSCTTVHLLQTNVASSQHSCRSLSDSMMILYLLANLHCRQSASAPVFLQLSSSLLRYRLAWIAFCDKNRLMWLSTLVKFEEAQACQRLKWRHCVADRRSGSPIGFRFGGTEGETAGKEPSCVG